MLYIIDDDSSVMRGYILLLQSAGLESRAFPSASEFLKGCSPTDNDLLILDMVMPGMNGCDLLEYLTEKQIRMNVIIVTAYDTPSARACAVKYGAIAYLRKPVDGNSLLDMVKFKYKSA